jgi:hypothetical protein
MRKGPTRTTEVVIENVRSKEQFAFARIESHADAASRTSKDINWYEEKTSRWIHGRVYKYMCNEGIYSIGCDTGRYWGMRGTMRFHKDNGRRWTIVTVLRASMPVLDKCDLRHRAPRRGTCDCPNHPQCAEVSGARM